MKKFINQLISLADHYDKKGMKKIANHIDSLLYIFAEDVDFVKSLTGPGIMLKW